MSWSIPHLASVTAVAVVAVVGSVLVAPGCDQGGALRGGADHGHGAPLTRTVEDACAAMWSAYADREIRCTGYVIPATYRADLVDACIWRATLPGIETAPSALDSCAALLPTSACTALPPTCVVYTGHGDRENPLSHFLQPRAVSSVYGGIGAGYFALFPRADGTLAEGRACADDAQCASGLCFGYSHDCGVCATVAPLGAACGPTTLCAEGECKDAICSETRLAAGTQCSASKGESVCQHGLYCDRTCRPFLPDGAMCRMIGPTNECQPQSRCDQFQCRPIRTVNLGEVCNGVTTLCAEGLGCIANQCAVPRSNLGAGEYCPGNQCAPGLSCAYSICQKPLVEGASCRTDEVCGEGASCVGWTNLDPRCWRLRGEGEACLGVLTCQPGLYCTAGTKLCKRQGAVGESCDTDRPCRSVLACEQGRCLRRACP